MTEMIKIGNSERRRSPPFSVYDLAGLVWSALRIIARRVFGTENVVRKERVTMPPYGFCHVVQNYPQALKANEGTELGGLRLGE